MWFNASDLFVHLTQTYRVTDSCCVFWSN